MESDQNGEEVLYFELLLFYKWSGHSPGIVVTYMQVTQFEMEKPGILVWVVKKKG